MNRKKPTIYIIYTLKQIRHNFHLSIVNYYTITALEVVIVLLHIILENFRNFMKFLKF